MRIGEEFLRIVGNVAGAEDALSEAFAVALVDWPVHGVPATPEAWLLTVARRKMIDAARQQRGESPRSGTGLDIRASHYGKVAGQVRAGDPGALGYRASRPCEWRSSAFKRAAPAAPRIVLWPRTMNL